MSTAAEADGKHHTSSASETLAHTQPQLTARREMVVGISAVASSSITLLLLMHLPLSSKAVAAGQTHPAVSMAHLISMIERALVTYAALWQLPPADTAMRQFATLL